MVTRRGILQCPAAYLFVGAHAVYALILTLSVVEVIPLD